MRTIKKGTKIKVGTQTLSYGSQINDMKDSTDLYTRAEYAQLRDRLKSDGFLLIRSIIPRERASEARKMLLDHASTKGAIETGTKATDGKVARTGKRYVEGFTIDAESGGVVGDRDTDDSSIEWAKIGNSLVMTAVYCGDSLRTFYQKLFGENNFTMLPQCTWLRLKSKNELTVEHADYYYFRQSTTICKENMLRMGDTGTDKKR